MQYLKQFCTNLILLLLTFILLAAEFCDEDQLMRVYGRKRMVYCPSTRFRSRRKRWTWSTQWDTSSRISSDSRWVLHGPV